MNTRNNIFEITKRVKCSPMNRLAYNLYRGWDLPDDEDGNDKGYMIEELNSTPNHKAHEGYISWITQEQFDNGYSLVEE